MLHEAIGSSGKQMIYIYNIDMLISNKKALYRNRRQLQIFSTDIKVAMNLSSINGKILLRITAFFFAPYMAIHVPSR